MPKFMANIDMSGNRIVNARIPEIEEINARLSSMVSQPLMTKVEAVKTLPKDDYPFLRFCLSICKLICFRG